ncbi:YopX family protein [Brevibacillus sp. VP]|uniref:YopX family protein n=1 Tax=unclassified Brevibacillus TaxID=2684853 RepID=UPI000E2ECCD3|nr:YopX family protein [Brevibacillus sp. VP]RFB35703.1 hypothetical protein DZB91_09420 [Brevibacillus sp. VP]
MREIKFRIWDKVNEIIIQDDGHFYITADGDVIGVNDDLDISESVILMQYTGLKDCNGKEIYEGDIFQAGSYPLTKEDDYVGVVEYDHDRFWGVKRVKAGSDVRGISDGMADGLWEFIDESIEIIGNIYEHPHLLNQE